MTVDLTCEGLSRAYGPVRALEGFTHSFGRGRIHALMGKNGSGKSTLVKLLNGAVAPDAGRILMGDRPVVFRGPAEAFAAGIVTVHQELSLVPDLSIAENIFLGRLPMRRRLGLAVVDWGAALAGARTLLEGMALDLDPAAPVGRLSIGQQQVVEIVKAMSFAPRVLLLDEPTSAQAGAEVGLLFRLLRDLKARGVTTIYISHRMSELFEIADTAVVLRDGALVGAVEVAETTTDAIVDMMFGETARAARSRHARPMRGETVLEVRGLTRAPAVADVSFDLHAGEILGIAGLLGAGRTELLRAVFGADPADRGTVRLFGAAVDPSPAAMKARGLGYTPENRKQDGLILDRSIHDNLCTASLPAIARRGVITRAAEAPFVARQIAGLSIKAPDPAAAVRSLSGGNQQKVVIGNWLNTSPRVMFFDEPSRGVDVGAKQQLFQIIWAKAAEGLAVIFVSSELEELLEVCDRILVMRQGRITGERDPATTPLAALYAACMGEAA
jgi:ABC-type sugar transport system ATPase subunit